MPKKKSPKNLDQPELPLDGGDSSAGKANEGTPPASVQSKAATDRKPAAGADKRGTEPVGPAAAGPGDNGVPGRARRRDGGRVEDEAAPLARSYRNWFLDYASYVILDRAVPHIDDGLKPVQRRVL
ncbi:MAG: DNA topoisomerase, partial [Opitutus sp.]